MGRVDVLQSDLQRLTADNSTEQEHLRTLAPILRRKLEEMSRTVQIRSEDGFDASLKIVQTDAGIGFMQQIERILGTMKGEEQRLLAQRIDAEATAVPGYEASLRGAPCLPSRPCSGR